MARTAGFDDDIPAVMIGKNEVVALRAANTLDASAVATFSEFVTPVNRILRMAIAARDRHSSTLLLSPT